MPTIGPLATAATALAGFALIVSSGPVRASEQGCLGTPDPLGPARVYTELVEGDSQRAGASLGAVAVGGDLDTTAGFTVGGALAPGPLPHALVVGGTLVAGSADQPPTVVLNGGLAAASTSGTNLTADPIVTGPVPLDIATIFTDLRQRVADISALPATGTIDGPPDDLVLRGNDPELNVFRLDAAALAASTQLRIKVPPGSTTIVDVTGPVADLTAGPLTVRLWDATEGAYAREDKVLDGTAAPGPDYLAVRERLLWSFGGATEVRTGTAAWPGTVLAPNAAVAFGSPEVGAGVVDGSLIAAALTSGPGAQTLALPFAGCFPVATTVATSTPGPSNDPATSAPATSAPAAPDTSTPSTPAPIAADSSPTTAVTTVPDTTTSTTVPPQPRVNAPRRASNQATTTEPLSPLSATVGSTTPPLLSPGVMIESQAATSTTAATTTTEDEESILDDDLDDDEYDEYDDEYDEYEYDDDYVDDEDDYLPEEYEDFADEDYDDLSSLADSGGDPRRALGTALVGLASGSVLILLSRRGRASRDGGTATAGPSGMI